MDGGPQVVLAQLLMPCLQSRSTVERYGYCFSSDDFPSLMLDEGGGEGGWSLQQTSKAFRNRVSHGVAVEVPDGSIQLNDLNASECTIGVISC
eukprot:955631-Amphidinium_carterae.1